MNNKIEDEKAYLQWIWIHANRCSYTHIKVQKEAFTSDLQNSNTFNYTNVDMFVKLPEQVCW